MTSRASLISVITISRGSGRGRRGWCGRNSSSMPASGINACGRFDSTFPDCLINSVLFAVFRAIKYFASVPLNTLLIRCNCFASSLAEYISSSVKLNNKKVRRIEFVESCWGGREGGKKQEGIFVCVSLVSSIEVFDLVPRMDYHYYYYYYHRKIIGEEIDFLR